MNVDLSYPAKIEFDGEVYQVQFVDIENCFTYGETLDEAIHNAEDVLGAMLKSLIKDGEPLPIASKTKKGMYELAPFPEVAGPLELLLLRRQKGKTIEEVARLLDISKQRYSEIENGKNLTLKTLHRVSKALGGSTYIGITALS